MAGEVAKELQSVQTTGDEFVISNVVTWDCNRGTGDDLVKQYRGIRNPEYGFYKASTVVKGAGSGQARYDRVVITFEDLASKELPIIRGLFKGGTIPFPLERHPDYRCLWNHHVVQAVGEPETPLVYSQWEDIKDLADTGATGDPAGTWQKSNQALSKAVTIPTVAGDKFNATKPGVQSFVDMTADVTQIVYTRDSADTDAAVAIIGKRALPEVRYRFGLTPGDDRDGDPIPVTEAWLVMSTDVKRVNDWYEINQTFRFARKGWDPDIYESA